MHFWIDTVNNKHDIGTTHLILPVAWGKMLRLIYETTVCQTQQRFTRSDVCGLFCGAVGSLMAG